jgi:RimJ/RimL family protein N-acetyltransferase
LSKLEPVVLEGEIVRLTPLSLVHVDALAEVLLDPVLWRWTVSDVQTRGDLERYVREAITSWERGQALPFATVDRATGRIVGTTRFGAWSPGHRRVEIGWTTVARPWQRTAINTDAKLQMMTHAFEALGCMRVELKTDCLNEQSRAAILRLGAKEEGILRKHSMTETGRIRDTVYYSVLEDEWPEVKARLRRFLERKLPA